MRMPHRVQMHDPPHIHRPDDVARILRTRDEEACGLQPNRGSTQKLFQFWLPVRSIGSHVAQITGKALRGWPSMVALGIKTAIERDGMTCSESLLDLLEHRASRKTEEDVEFRNLIRCQVIRLSLLS